MIGEAYQYQTESIQSRKIMKYFTFLLVVALSSLVRLCNEISFLHNIS